MATPRLSRLSRLSRAARATRAARAARATRATRATGTNAEEKTWYEKVFNIEKLELKDFFDVLYKSVIVVGIIIGILYFIFYLKAFPNMDFASIATYTVAIASTSILLIVLVCFTTIIPINQLTINITQYNKNKIRKKLFWIILIFSLFPTIFPLYFTADNKLKLDWNTGYLFVAIFILILITYAIQYKDIIKKFNRYRRLFGSLPKALLYMFWETIKASPPFIFSGFLFFVCEILYFIVLFANAQNNESVGFISVAVAILFFILNFVYLINMKAFVFIAPLFTLFFFTEISMVSNNYNLIIAAPIKALKFGYYNSHIVLKDEYLNELNTTNVKLKKRQCVFVLSNIGTEYFFQLTDCNDSIKRFGITYRVPKDKIALETFITDIKLTVEDPDNRLQQPATDCQILADCNTTKTDNNKTSPDCNKSHTVKIKYIYKPCCNNIYITDTNKSVYECNKTTQ